MMNITAIIKKNILMLVAIATVVGFSAFKVADTSLENSSTMLWFNVNPDGTIQTNSGSADPSDECEDENLEEVCEIQLNPLPDGSAPVSNINQTTYAGGSEPHGIVRFREETP